MHGLIRLEIVGIDDKEGAQISVVTNKIEHNLRLSLWSPNKMHTTFTCYFFQKHIVFDMITKLALCLRRILILLKIRPNLDTPKLVCARLVQRYRKQPVSAPGVIIFTL